eukprot:6213255-Pleurochrysis_carterae.AAC.2
MQPAWGLRLDYGAGTNTDIDQSESPRSTSRSVGIHMHSHGFRNESQRDEAAQLAESVPESYNGPQMAPRQDTRGVDARTVHETHSITHTIIKLTKRPCW